MTELATPWPFVLVLAAPVVSRTSYTEAEWEFGNAFKLQKRRDEWIWSRAAVKQLAVRLGIAAEERSCGFERPWLTIEGKQTDWFVSVSHSPPYAAAVIGREPVGIDVQLLREVSPEITRFFLSDEEEAELRRCRLDRALLHFWCAKEAAWKRSSPRYESLRQQPLQLLKEGEQGLRFDLGETLRIGDAFLGVSPLLDRADL